jgi:lipoprotein signal peptidase
VLKQIGRRWKEWRNGARDGVGVGAGSQRFRRRSTDGEARRGLGPTLAIILAIAMVDWFIKVIIAATVPIGGFVEVWEGRLALWHVRNPEMVLGLWGNLPLASRQVIAATAGVLAVLLLFEVVGRGHRLPSRRRPWVWVFLGTALGGMLGNLGERALHWGVTDYLSFAWGAIWLPPGNFADLALLAAIPLAVPVIVFELQARRQRGKQNPARIAGWTPSEHPAGS